MTVNYKIAQLAKKLGFKEPTLYAFDKCEMLCSHAENVFHKMNYNDSSYYSAPNYQQMINWLINNHQIFVEVTFSQFIKTYRFEINKTNGVEVMRHFDFDKKTKFDSYDEALAEGVLEALEALI